MTTTKFEAFHIIGLAKRTRNEDQHITLDIQKLWDTFIANETMHKIPNKLENTLFGIYTDYENAASGYYTAIVGCKVSSLVSIPEGMIGTTIKNGNYTKFIARGDISKDAIPNAWAKIWRSDLDRTYITDFEVYEESAMNTKNAEVDIYIGVQ